MEHETGTRDLRQVGGLRRALPATAVLSGAAAFSMAGFPPLLGYIAKETLLETALEASGALPSLLVIAAAVTAATLAVGYSLLFVLGVFWGKQRSELASVHEAGWTMLLPPGILAALSLFLALPPLRAALSSLLAAAASSTLGKATDVSLALWYGVNVALLLTIAAIGGGVLLYLGRWPIRRVQGGWLARPRLDALYDAALVGLNRLASGLTGLLQTGSLSHYLTMILAALIVLVGAALISAVGAAPPPSDVIPLLARLATGVPFYEVAAALVMILAAVAVATTSSRLGAVVGLGVVGFFMTLFFVVYSGPDLALTQLLVETLIVILLLLVFYFLPQFVPERSSRLERWRHLGIAAGVGILVTALTLLVLTPAGVAPTTAGAPPTIAVQTTAGPADSTISEFYLQESVPSAFGANVVNVILVDFRALDTLGEMTVLVIAVLGAYSLIRLRLSERPERAVAAPESYADGDPPAATRHEQQAAEELP